MQIAERVIEIIKDMEKQTPNLKAIVQHSKEEVLKVTEQTRLRGIMVHLGHNIFTIIGIGMKKPNLKICPPPLKGIVEVIIIQLLSGTVIS